MHFLIRHNRRFRVIYNTRTFRTFLKLPLAYLSVFWMLNTLLLASSGPAYAEWVQIDKTYEGMTTYIDPATMRRKGDLVKMWYMMDFFTERTIWGRTSLSAKAQGQYDCSEERLRKLAATYFAGNMGGGKVNHSDADEAKWAPVAPGSVGEALWKAACSNK